MTLFVPKNDKKFTTKRQVIYQNYLSGLKKKPMEKASEAVLDIEKVDMIGCRSGSPETTIIRSALLGMLARAATSYSRRFSVKDAFGTVGKKVGKWGVNGW